jgi:transposase-like protein
MKNSTKAGFAQLGFVLVLLSFLTLALLGQVPTSQAGWIASPPQVPGAATVPARKRRRRFVLSLADRLQAVGRYLVRSWPQPLLRTLLVVLLWWGSGCPGSPGLLGVPLGLWLTQAVLVGWPRRGRRGSALPGLWAQALPALLGALSGLCLGRWLQSGLFSGPPSGAGGDGRSLPLFLGGCALGGHEAPYVDVQHGADGSYEATLCGHFTLRVSGDDPFRPRLLLLLLRQLESPGPARRGRCTRTGCTPFVRQTQLAAWLGCPQPDISRWEDYWRRGDWADLLSLHSPEVLTAELVQRIVTVCVAFPSWDQEQVAHYLQGQGVAVTERQVRQAMEQSGWWALRRELRRRYHWTAEQCPPREDFLLQELLRLNQLLLEHLETGQPLPAEEQVALTDLRSQLHEVGVEPPPSLRAVPWLLRLEAVLFGARPAVPDETIRCPQCGSPHVGRKSRKPRRKQFYAEPGQLQTVDVYRYYCRNPHCARKTFTHLPPGLLPYSRQRLEVHTLAVQAYAWSYSTYRRVGQSLRVSEMTVYRWVSAWGQELLPVAALFGLVRSSGVVGIDEKYVLVPKNDKAAGKMRRWMYVYLAVDVYTYDLLHIALYPHNNQDSAHAFLLALRAKGYHPRVIVTDLRRDYGAVIPQVFARARHHECIFHAEQEIGRYLRDTWGRGYAATHPEAVALHDAVKKMLQARTKRTAQKRYQALRERQEQEVQASPPLQWVFVFLETHGEHLLDAIESELIPRTNNAVEMVIRRFDQHYQNFCGFESLETARVYLGVFEKLYRFTPFSDDAQPEIRGKSPLELAGYDLKQIPMTWLCRGYSLEWPTGEEVLNVPSM